MTEEEKREKRRTRIWVDPCIDCDCGCGDGEDAIYLTFELPGVKKEDVHLHVVPQGLRLTATRGEHVEFVSEYSFLCPAKPEETKATYDNGLLRVEIPYTCPDPFKGSKPVTIE
ncbi:MAG: hypothetical protein Kow0069_12330 [Promethearchaeota archaeon]